MSIRLIVIVLSLTLSGSDWPSFATSESAEPNVFEFSTARNASRAKIKEPYAEGAINHYNRGVQLHQEGHLNSALSEYQSAIDLDGRMYEAWCNQGVIYCGQKHYDKAIEAFEKSLEIQERIWGSDNPRLCTPLVQLAALYAAHSRYVQAEQLYKRALPMAESSFNENYPAVLHAYASLLRKMNREAAASELEEKARHIRNCRLKAGQISDHANFGPIGEWKQKNWCFAGSPPPFQRFPQFVLGGPPVLRGYRQTVDWITDFHARERKCESYIRDEVQPTQQLCPKED